MTGAVGFLGSHLLLEWAERYPSSRAFCVVRAKAGTSAAERVHGALRVAAVDCGLDPDDQWNRAVLDRVTVLESDLATCDLASSTEVCRWVEEGDGFHVVHGAANLSFRAEDREQVWSTNVHGTQRFMEEISSVPGCLSLNYISTAYVAGDGSGTRMEDDVSMPGAFHNPYEESKWHAEQLVRSLAGERSVPFRIFRPSIIVGHSVTHRVSNATGFYKVMDMLRQLSLLTPPSEVAEVPVPSVPRASLDLVPVDVVSRELLHIMGVGVATQGKVFHLTNQRPLSFADVCFGVTELAGCKLVPAADAAPVRGASTTTAVARRGMRHYAPYFQQDRRYDRSNVVACGAGIYQDEYWMDLVELRHLAQQFLAAAPVPVRSVRPRGERLTNVTDITNEDAATDETMEVSA
jgi:thioester reductase-like protein